MPTSADTHEQAVVVSGVLSSQIGESWSEVAPVLKPAVDHSGGRSDIGSVKAGLVARDMQLWTARLDGRLMGAWVTKLSAYTAGAKICEIMFCAGKELEKWMAPGLAITEAWAFAQGYPRIEILGRFGWERLLKPYGYEKRYVVLEKDL